MADNGFADVHLRAHEFLVLCMVGDCWWIIPSMSDSVKVHEDVKESAFAERCMLMILVKLESKCLKNRKGYQGKHFGVANDLDQV